MLPGPVPRDAGRALARRRAVAWPDALGFLYIDGHARVYVLCRGIGYRAYETVALTRIGDACLRQGSPGDAVGYLQEALSLFREIGIQPDPIGDKFEQARACNGSAVLTTGPANVTRRAGPGSKHSACSAGSAASKRTRFAPACEGFMSGQPAYPQWTDNCTDLW
ncbi:MAG: hypothetical protein ACRDPY_00210 [Streptosporangiaceae bacterium]